ncbi:putative fatty acyl-CoA reductase CG5065 [Adelges cooleyi]|uniref:putative fatty acyl-CoA reductase CG5065 n=1 Tax=Adelges cooleyi TaxID=133065 RepID=UPI0021801666|nr:putative fatty acyl-CoA reductase CG5065 [Adelges cooleyi]XP_050426432.1 putative fatty acyl-CoA reductase CG5065 [Adelges cooleyi]XP_050426433.1 putative fatty acyl-CoA reductase CG5065 [Adelges cooleyi]
MASTSSPIADFFRGRHVLITGATGFMGKVLVEKLLRSCPNVACIYLLIRPKQGHDVRSRLDQLLNAVIFDWIKKNQPDSLKKLVPINGDVTQSELGISTLDQKTLTDNVSIVFHSAATVKFDEALKLSVAMNLLGTKRLVQLCFKMTKLEAFVHVSTAYCNCNRQDVEEHCYPIPADPEKIIQCVDCLDENLLESITPQIIQGWPNTYTFTKALAEKMLLQQGDGLPIVIVRPSIVTASWKEPIAGWVDNLNGPTGLLAGAGKGVLRTLLCHKNLVADLVPVDICINLLISAAWYTAINRPMSVKIYHCTSGTTNPIYWRDIERLGHEFILRHPFSDILWYPGGSFKSSRLVNSVCVTVFQMLPAYAIDTLARLSGKPVRLVRIHQRLQKAVSCLEFFTTHEWNFKNSNVQRLFAELDPNDRKTFYFDVSKLEWRNYVETYLLGTRRFVLKDDPSTVPNARIQLKRMYYLHRITQVAFAVLTVRYILLGNSSTKRFWFSALYFLINFIANVSSKLKFT